MINFFKKKLITTLTKLIRFILRVVAKELKFSSLNRNLYNLIKEDSIIDSFKEFKFKMKKSIIFEKKDDIREYAIKLAISDSKNSEDFFLEFGVYTGRSTNFFSRYVTKLYAFDSFEGLKEDWIGTRVRAGHFNLNKKLPKLEKNIYLVVGLVQETLDEFLKNNTPKIKFVHMDMDTYETSKFVLEKIKPNLHKGSIIIFDQIHNRINWENGEYKALKETFSENEYIFKAFCVNGSQAVIQIL